LPVTKIRIRPNRQQHPGEFSMTNLLDAASVLTQYIADRQTNRTLTLTFPQGDGPEALMAANRLDAYEGLSRDFMFTVEVLSEDARIALKDVQGKNVTIEMVRADGSKRYFNGYVFEFRLVRTDGTFAFYDMVLLPWLAYLRLQRDNRLFHGQTLQEQFTAICAAYDVNDWQWQVAGPDELMTDACQFDETTYNYFHRRLEERGLHYRYEHRADGHTLVIADDSTQAPAIDGDIPDIEWQAEAGSLDENGIHDWTPVRRIVPSKVSLSTFDFKNPQPKQVDVPSINRQGDVLNKEVYEYAGAYGFKNSEHGDRLARLRMEEIEASAKHFEARGNNGFVMPGRSFRLTGHFDAHALDSELEPGEFLVLEARHEVQCNYLQDPLTRPHYENRLSCIRKGIPWRPGRGFNSVEPKIHGIQTATVTCPEGEEVHTDPYGRVHVQFHWDREGRFDQHSSALVRVATASAGDGFGQVAIPRRGQEVIVHWLDGNPDRPIIIGSVPNARNMPPRFHHEGSLPANHPQSGWSTRELHGNRLQHLRFNDKTGKISTQLATDHADTQLSLGDLQTDMREGETQPRGEGLELRTLAAAVLRAAQGLLLLTEPNGHDGRQLARAELQAGLDAARELMKSLDAAATTAQADAIDAAPQQQLEAAIDQLEGGTNTAPDASGGQRPVIGIGGSAGIALSTPKSATVYTGENLDIATQGDTQQSTNKRWLVNAGQSISWFVAGIADQARQAAQAIAVKLIAARGKILVQAQRDGIDLQAERDIALGANGAIRVDAQGGITLTEQGGAQIVLSGGNITMKCQTYTVQAGAYTYTGQAGAVPQLPRMPGSTELRPWLGLNYLEETGEPIAGAPYDVRYDGGVVQSGTLDAAGLARHDTVPDSVVREVVYKPRTPGSDEPVERLKTLLS